MADMNGSSARAAMPARIGCASVTISSISTSLVTPPGGGFAYGKID